MTTQQTPSFRFAHAPNIFDSTKCPYTGLTVCYVRMEDYVCFTYALCLKDDQYSKFIGREKTILTWIAVGGGPTNILADAYLDPKTRSGIMGTKMFFDIANDSNAFSDQMVNDLSMFDFKHAFISKCLVEFISEHIVLNRFPDSRV